MFRLKQVFLIFLDCIIYLLNLAARIMEERYEIAGIWRVWGTAFACSQFIGVIGAAASEIHFRLQAHAAYSTLGLLPGFFIGLLWQRGTEEGLSCDGRYWNGRFVLLFLFFSCATACGAWFLYDLQQEVSMIRWLKHLRHDQITSIDIYSGDSAPQDRIVQITDAATLQSFSASTADVFDWNAVGRSCQRYWIVINAIDRQVECGLWTYPNRPDMLFMDIHCQCRFTVFCERLRPWFEAHVKPLQNAKQLLPEEPVP